MNGIVVVFVVFKSAKEVVLGRAYGAADGAEGEEEEGGGRVEY